MELGFNVDETNKNNIVGLLTNLLDKVYETADDMVFNDTVEGCQDCYTRACIFLGHSLNKIYNVLGICEIDKDSISDTVKGLNKEYSKLNDEFKKYDKALQEKISDNIEDLYQNNLLDPGLMHKSELVEMHKGKFYEEKFDKIFEDVLKNGSKENKINK